MSCEAAAQRLVSVVRHRSRAFVPPVRPAHQDPRDLQGRSPVQIKAGESALRSNSATSNTTDPIADILTRITNAQLVAGRPRRRSVVEA